MALPRGAMGLSAVFRETRKISFLLEIYHYKDV